MSWFWLLLSIVCEVGATLSLRASVGMHRKRWLIPVVAGYALAFFFLSLTLAAGMPLGVAYGLWSAIGVVVVCLLGRVIWRDPLTRRMLLGIGFIVVGVILVEVS